jgi:tetratricopeptide (TPR) repeat protein
MTSDPGAIPYLANGLKDPAPRVRAAAAHSLFLLGQLEVVPVLNRMLLVPSPVPVLSACHALGQLMRIHPPTLRPDHPLPLSLSRQARRVRLDHPEIPEALRFPELPRLLADLATAHGDLERIQWVLEHFAKMFPAEFAPRRMLAALLALREKPAGALSLLEICLNEHPSVLADLIDGYRLAMVLGDLPKADAFGEKAREIYKTLLKACLDLCQKVRGSGAQSLLEKLHQLSSPSMNLYSAMIQLKALEGDLPTLLDLLTELFLARPTNAAVLRRLASLLPAEAGELKTALTGYAETLA